ncbi:alanine racemase [Desulfonema magnum]|uniref:Alanine racemase n=1 Tax=Desulfonema magnum TaxID=45655 RepID=A0A975BQ62_9BACT|nr:alanine racemase [Desulfonema magnum]QTA89525.1 Alanine racemase [Desulfonema magnum]
MTKELLNLTASVPTPFLIIDEEILEKNIRRIHNYAEQHGFSVRPHVKTHKSLCIARKQMEAGAVGICTAKAEETRVMAALGDTDITVAYPAAGIVRAEILAKISQKQKVRVAADSEYVMASLADAAVRYNTILGILVMFDAGLHRCGVADPEEVVRLARYAETKDGLSYDGIQMYLGQLYGDAARDPHAFRQIRESWEPLYEALCSAGLRPETVSSGSTPSLENTHLIPHITEIRVGTAFLNDYFVLKFGHCKPEDCAARVITSVVSDVVPGQVIIDAGSKALSAKQLLRHENLEMGYIPEHPHARIFRLHEEHGWVDISRCEHPPRVGDRMSIIPVNVALCMNLYDTFYLRACDGSLQKEKVDARGCCV